MIDLVESIKLTKIDATRAPPRMGRGRHRNTAPRLPPRGDEPARPAFTKRCGRRLETRRARVCRPGSPRCASTPRRTATTRCLYEKCSGATAMSCTIYQQQHNVEGARGGRAATPAPTCCGTTTARSARSTSRRGRRRAATTRRRTNWSCGTSTTSTLLRRRRRGNFLEVRRPKPVLRHFDRSIEARSAPGALQGLRAPRDASGL